jgi:hypothetical protein
LSAPLRRDRTARARTFFHSPARPGSLPRSPFHRFIRALTRIASRRPLGSTEATKAVLGGLQGPPTGASLSLT